MRNNLNEEILAQESTVIKTLILQHYPSTQAIYLFGSYGTENQRADSDLDVAILLPVEESGKIDFWEWIEISNEIAAQIKAERVDLINLRLVDTVFQKEIISTNRRIYCRDTDAADEFEMLTLSFYQKLNEERKDIITAGLSSGSFYHV